MDEDPSASVNVIVREIENSQRITNNENNSLEDSLIENKNNLNKEDDISHELKDLETNHSNDKIVTKFVDNDSLGIKEMFKEQNLQLKCHKCEHKA